MPPKAKPAAPSKKAETKKKEKIIEDKTFGLKNKKGAKTQKFIQQVEKQVKSGNQNARKGDELRDKTTKKEEKKKEQMELNLLFKPVTAAQKVDKGVDPKSVLCAFFKQGQCGKGDKCKFSHNLDIEKKAEKKSIYIDTRDESDDDDVDDEKLEEKRKLRTRGICKHFLAAVEGNKYGWFWECPNGGEKCQFRHALPEGYALNRDKPKEKKEDEISIEELVEVERAKLSGDLTKINLESFLAWKKKRITEKRAAAKKAEAEKRAGLQAGKSSGLSGRDMFTFRPEMAIDDQTEEGEAAFDYTNLRREPEEGEEEVSNGPVNEITLEQMSAAAREADSSGTQAPAERLHTSNHVNNVSDTTGEGIAGGGIEDVPVDESLFIDDDEDLDELEENLEQLEVSE